MPRLVVATLALAAMASIGLAADVLTLTGETFSDAVKKNDKLIVEFYAPWCGHCKRLEPEYEKAAGELKGEGIALAKVDATEEGNKALASKFGVRGFPTLKIFRGDEDGASEYGGPRDADGIVSYAKKQFGPAYKKIESEDDVKKATTPGDDLSVVGVFPDGDDSAAAQAFKATADSLRDEATFVYVTDSKLIKDADGKETIVLYRNFDVEVVKYDGKMDKGSLMSWVDKMSSPRLIAMDGKARNKKALQKVFSEKKPKLLGVIKADDNNLKDFQAVLTELSDSQDDVNVVYVDPAENSRAMEFFGAKAADAPLLLVHDPSNDAKFLSGTIAVDKVKSWFEDYKAGKIDRTIKSEDPPEKNDGPVTIVTAKTFKDIVYSGKNVLMEFYAPWCGHCKKLAPVYDELGEACKDMDNITIAKMDATANDVVDDKIKVTGFPTIKFVTKSGEVKDYSGDRSLNDFKKFLEKEVGVSFPEPAQAKKDESEDGKDEL